MGSILCGSHDFIGGAHKWRKMVGGGMRQAGVLAAAGLVALDNMVERLADDHSNAKRLAEGLANIQGISVDPTSIQTNIVIFEISESAGNANDVINELANEGVLVTYPGQQSLRMVTHRHISASDIDEALSRVAKVMTQMNSK